MYCKHCGKNNPTGSKFCQHCGKDILDLERNTEHESKHHSTGRHIDQNTSPFPYVISTLKLTIMSLVTFGIYDIYWFSRQWKSFSAENKLKHRSFALWIYALFSPLSSYSLFKQISENVKEVNKGKGLEAGALAILYFFLPRILLGFLPLIPAQNRINIYWEKKLGEKLVKSDFGLWNWITVVFVALILMFAYYSEEKPTDSTLVTETEEVTTVSENSQEEIVSSVVNIFCPSTVRGESPSGGSGVIITGEGIVLTNSHIIPQNETEVNVDETGCLVVLPDSTTGQPSEMYLANPIVYPGLSDDYDLAFLEIYSAYFSEEDREYKGTFPRDFPAFDDSTRCTTDDIKLGDPVRIFGYPAISGGYSLTVTDGVVSSFPSEGLIVTSAKISHGNSGGLAVDKNGCMIGVPSLVSSDENESLGVIYSMDLVHEFASELSEYLEE
jgi:hypothetical protein